MTLPDFPTLPSLPAAILYDDLTESGVTLWATKEGKLRYKPKSALEGADVERLKKHKEELLELLNAISGGEGITVPSPASLRSPEGETPHKTATSAGDGKGTAQDGRRPPRPPARGNFALHYPADTVVVLLKNKDHARKGYKKK